MTQSDKPRKEDFKEVTDYYQAMKDSGLELHMAPEEFIKYMRWLEMKK